MDGRFESCWGATSGDSGAAVGVRYQLGGAAPRYLVYRSNIDFEGLHAVPDYSLLTGIVYCRNGWNVNAVIVNGESEVLDGGLLNVNEAGVIRLAGEEGRSITSRAPERETDLASLWRTGRLAGI